MTHTVTLTRLPDEGSDDYEYTFGGEHDGNCESGRECMRKACSAMNPDYGDERLRHGKHHWHADGTWWVYDSCALRYVFETVTEEETFDGIPLGTYPLHVEWDGEYWHVEVQYSEPTEP
jgi:hypothetical protein